MSEKILSIQQFMPQAHPLLIRGLDFLANFNTLQKINYSITQDFSQVASLEEFSSALNMQLKVNRDLSHIPKDVPLIIVNNHPYGLLECLIIQQLLADIRPDIKFVGGEMIPKLFGDRPQYISVYNYSRKTKVTDNIGMMKTMINWLQQKHAIHLCPSGITAGYSWQDKAFIDPPWFRSVGLLQRKSSAAVLPIFIDGHHSLFYRFCRLTLGRNANLFLIRDNLRQARKPIRVNVGDIIPHEALQRFNSFQAITDELRAKTFSLR